MHRIRIEPCSGAVVVSAEGELDAYVAPELSSSLDGANQERVVIDLERVSFMDSTVLGLIVKAVRELRERGADVRVLLPRGTARRIFEITTLDRVLPIAATRVEALSVLDDDARAG